MLRHDTARSVEMVDNPRALSQPLAYCARTGRLIPRAVHAEKKEGVGHITEP